MQPPSSATQRRALEHFIAARFQRAYGATLTQFLGEPPQPMLLCPVVLESVKDQDTRLRHGPIMAAQLR